MTIKLDKQFLYSFVTFAHRYIFTFTCRCITNCGVGIEASFPEFFTLFSVIIEIRYIHIKKTEYDWHFIWVEIRIQDPWPISCVPVHVCECVHIWISVSLKAEGEEGGKVLWQSWILLQGSWAYPAFWVCSLFLWPSFSSPTVIPSSSVRAFSSFQLLFFSSLSKCMWS